MNPDIQDFIDANFERSPACTIKLKTFVQEFLQSLPQNQRSQWTRAEITAELSREFQFVVEDKVTRVVGLGLPIFERGQLA